MVDDNILKSNKYAVTFGKSGEDGEAEYDVTGRVAQTIYWLVYAGKHGVTAYEMSSWALRLGAYIYTLRHRYGLEIRTDREAHDGGTHGRYILETPVRILLIEPIK